jgi:DNA-binding response OmpR family regulator
VARSRQTILIVEDNEELRRMYAAALSVAGFDARQAADGLEALRYLEGNDPPDLIVLDLTLPHVSGYVVREEIAAHAQTRDIPIVIVTGSSSPLDKLDVACVLRKPVAPDQLVWTVRSCLRSGAPGQKSST